VRRMGVQRAVAADAVFGRSRRLRVAAALVPSPRSRMRERGAAYRSACHDRGSRDLFLVQSGRRIPRWRRRIPEQSQQCCLQASGRSALRRWLAPSRSRPTSAPEQPLEHALRTAVLAVRLGELAGASAQELADTYYVALLHASGCTSNGHEAAQLFGDDIAHRAAFFLIDPDNPAEVLAFYRANVGVGPPPGGPRRDRRGGHRQRRPEGP
jgi:hypothetical protein